MHAKDLMQVNVRTIRPDKSLGELSEELIEADINGLPVVDDGRLVGMVSRSDIVRQLLLERDLARADIGFATADWAQDGLPPDAALDVANIVGERLQQLQVKDIMNRLITSISPACPLQEVAEIMVRKHVHRLPVVQDDQLVGLVTSVDVVSLVATGRLVVTPTAE